MRKLFAVGGVAALLAAVTRRIGRTRTPRKPISRDQAWGDYRARRGSW